MKKYSKRPGLKAVDTGTRKVAPSYGREAFTTYASKAGQILVFETDAERLAAQLLDFDPRVRRLQAQPYTVDLVEGRLLRTTDQRDDARRKYAGRKGASIYTPDFHVERSDGKHIAVEVKLHEFTGAASDHDRIDQATRVLATYGHDMVRVVIPSNLQHPLRSNIFLLHHAAERPDLRPAGDITERVQSLADEGARTMFDYARGLGISVDLMPALIFHGALSADVVTCRMEGKTLMEPAHGSLDHLELMERLVQ